MKHSLPDPIHQSRPPAQADLRTITEAGIARQRERDPADPPALGDGRRPGAPDLLATQTPQLGMEGGDQQVEQLRI
ncbi:hypothetical protein [Phenylobacterium sp.]|uniref:hypothetical protein n=1 Tax=Phenylobacterium sp. TaxID=1871053 RepID=UPI00374D0985